MHHLSALLSCHCDVHFTRGPYYRCLTCSGSHRPHGTVRFESRRADSRVHSLDHLAILQPYDLDYPSDFSSILSSLTTSWQYHLLHYSFKYCFFVWLPQLWFQLSSTSCFRAIGQLSARLCTWWSRKYLKVSTSKVNFFLFAFYVPYSYLTTSHLNNHGIIFNSALLFRQSSNAVNCHTSISHSFVLLYPHWHYYPISGLQYLVHQLLE